VQVKLIEAIGWADIAAMLDRGEIHLGQNLAHATQPRDGRFASHALEAVDLLAVADPQLKLGEQGAIEIDRLATQPLLLLDKSYILRRTFDAACRLARCEPDVAFESRTPHTLLAMAESGHGVAIVPSSLRIHRYALQVAAVTYRSKPLREPLAIFWDKRRPLPRYATVFCEMLAKQVRDVFPITRPSEPTRRPTARRTGRKAFRRGTQ
jgi:DNA-binding transcriptional LysR family regulator